MSDDSKAVSRRTFCATATATAAGTGLVVLGLPACESSPDTLPLPDLATPIEDLSAPPGPDMVVGTGCPNMNVINAGPVATLAVGDARPVHDDEGGIYYVCRGESGLYALSAICPHMGCQVGFNRTTDQFDCPCHYSTFDLGGKNLTGPAAGQNLIKLPICVDSLGNAILSTDFGLLG